MTGKYTFNIIDNVNEFDGNIFSRNFKIGGKYSDCINLSVIYKNNIPSVANIPSVVYDEECSLDAPLERGGTVIMMKTLLNYVQSKIPSIKVVYFDDYSMIECASQEEILTKKSKFQKRGTHVIPTDLNYFSIAFNGQTWYEKHFNAKLKDPEKYRVYREEVDKLLHSPITKSSIPFDHFKKIAVPVKTIPEYMNELEDLYNKSSTFGEFFKSIPTSDRCRLVRDWISVFMNHFLFNIFEHTGWLIEIPVENIRGGTTRKKYYCPKNKIKYNFTYRKNFILPDIDCL